MDGKGEPVFITAELAKLLGKATGVVSTVQVSDAIAGTGNPDYNDNGQLRSTALYEWIGEDIWTALKDGAFASDDGVAWELIQDRADIIAAGNSPANGHERLALIVEAYTGHQFYRSGASAPGETEVSIEGGSVDRAMHANNIGRMIEEYIEFNNTVKFVIDWVNSPESRATWEDTLLIVTADHDHLLFGPDGATIPYQPVLPDQDGDGVPEYIWLSNNHSNQIVPLYAYGADSQGVRALADDTDAVFDAQGRAVAGSGRSYTDRAELGDHLLGQISLGATGSSDHSALGG